MANIYITNFRLWYDNVPSIIFNIITYLGILTTTALEVINIKEYYELSKQKDNEEKIETIRQVIESDKQKTKDNQKQKNITYTEITECIEQCSSISELNEIKEIISPELTTHSKEKTKQKKR